MRLGRRARNGQTLLAGIMLAAFAARALVPAGFMPAADQPFSIEICWEGFPAALLAHGAHHHHPGSPPHTEHCVFGNACSAGPIPHLSLPGDHSIARRLEPVEFASTAQAVRLVHLPQPRAPPGRLS
jgi:hypothetical protein